MNILNFTVNGTQLTLLGKTSEQSSGSVQADKCRFTFNETEGVTGSWHGYANRIAFFGTDRDRMKPVFITQELSGTAYYCYIPREVQAAIGTGGSLYISVSGSNGAGGTLRTKLYALSVADSGLAQVFLTDEESAAFLTQMETLLGQLSGKAVDAAAVNAAGDLSFTLHNGTVLSAGNVKGPKGDTGATGAKGDKGDTGAKGDSVLNAYLVDGHLYLEVEHYFPELDEMGTLDIDCGTVVYPGPKGDKGDKGDTGATGASGSNGSDGVDGKSAYELAVEAGFDGTQAQWLASLKGEKGDTGAPGASGAYGPQGLSAYEVAVDNGFEGTEQQWLASLVGATGAQGPKGDKGDTGATGPAGSNAKQIASLYAETDQGYYGKLGVIFNDNTWLRSDLKIKAKLGTTGYDMQELAEYLNGQDVDTIATQGGTGKLQLWLKGGGVINSNIPVIAWLPTGTNNGTQDYDMQQLATLLYSKITALEARVAELEALTRVTISGTTYAYKLDAQNGKPVLVLTEVQ